MSKVFINATLVLPDRLMKDGWLLEQNGKIAGYGPGTRRKRMKLWIAAGCICRPALSMSIAMAAAGEALGDWNWSSTSRQ